VPVKKVIKKHKNDDELNINGKKRKWGEFTKKFFEDVDRMERQGHPVKFA
jgi:hypothetical protein